MTEKISQSPPRRFVVISPAKPRFADPILLARIEAALESAMPTYRFKVVFGNQRALDDFIIRPDRPTDRAVIEEIATILAQFSTPGPSLN